MNMEKLYPYVLIILIIHLLGHPAGKRAVGGTAFPCTLRSVGGPALP